MKTADVWCLSAFSCVFYTQGVKVWGAQDDDRMIVLTEKHDINRVVGACVSLHLVTHVGNNISETYPRRIGQGLNDASCILSSMLSSLMGLPNPAWVSLGNVVSHMARDLIEIA